MCIEISTWCKLISRGNHRVQTRRRIGISAHDVEGILDIEDVKESEILTPVNNHLSKLKSDFLQEDCML